MLLSYPSYLLDFQWLWHRSRNLERQIYQNNYFWRDLFDRPFPELLWVESKEGGIPKKKDSELNPLSPFPKLVMVLCWKSQKRSKKRWVYSRICTWTLTILVYHHIDFGFTTPYLWRVTTQPGSSVRDRGVLWSWEWRTTEGVFWERNSMMLSHAFSSMKLNWLPWGLGLTVLMSSPAPAFRKAPTSAPVSFLAVMSIFKQIIRRKVILSFSNRPLLTYLWTWRVMTLMINSTRFWGELASGDF